MGEKNLIFRPYGIANIIVGMLMVFGGLYGYLFVSEEMCIISAILVALGIFLMLIGAELMKARNLTLDSEHLTVRENGRVTRRYALRDIKRVVVDRRNGLSVRIYLKDGGEYVMNPATEERERIELFLEEMKKLGKEHGFPVEEKAMESDGMNTASLSEIASGEDAPYEVR